ncbi:MAG: aldo/keto reductase [Nitrospirae bacterium]|nr:aldo/keto reductase [Nitrospirota bacterium]
MKYRTLGKTKLSVSEIGLGTAQIGGPSLIGGAYVGSPRIERAEALAILERAFEAGVNFFDSSDKYGDGEAERLLGESFGSRRDRVIIATKCGITSSGERRFDREYVRGCLHQSLENLKTDYADIFQLTKPGIHLIRSGEIYDILDELKQEGKIRFFGVSTGTEEETLQLIDDNRVDTLQVFYNLLHIRPNEVFIGRASDAGIGLIIRSPLSSGVLTGKYDYKTTFSAEDDRRQFLHGATLADRVDMVNAIITRFGLDRNYAILHFSLNYLLSNDRISTIIPGVSKLRQFEDILRLNTIERMGPALILEVENFVKEHCKP